jgi:hypothetical protein
MGLPLQSVNGIRLRNVSPAVIICRHTGTVSEGERYPLRNEHQNLLDNEWIYLMVMDPLNGNKNITSTKSQLILLEKK